jgi:hypothetical protein
MAPSTSPTPVPVNPHPSPLVSLSITRICPAHGARIDLLCQFADPWIDPCAGSVRPGVSDLVLASPEEEPEEMNGAGGSDLVPSLD